MLSDLMHHIPGLILLEDCGPLSLWKSRFRDRFVNHLNLGAQSRPGPKESRLDEYVGEEGPPLNQGPRTRSLPDILERCRGIIVADQRHKHFLEKVFARKPIVIVPYDSDSDQVHTETGRDTSATSRKSDRLSVGIISQENDTVLSSELECIVASEEMKGASDRAIVMQIMSLSGDPLHFDSGIAAFRQFISDKDLMIFDNLGPTFYEYRLTGLALERGIPVVIHASSLWGHLTEEYLFKLVPGRNVRAQLLTILTTIASDRSILDYMSQRLYELFHRNEDKAAQLKEFQQFLLTGGTFQDFDASKNDRTRRWSELICRDIAGSERCSLREIVQQELSQFFD